MGSDMHGGGFATRPWVTRMARFAKEVGHHSRSVYIVDEQPLICQGMAAILREDGYVIMGTQTKVSAALADVCMLGADVVVLDIAGEGKSRLDAIPALVMQGKKVVVCSLHSEAARVGRALKSGASAYVSKADDVTCLLGAVRAAVAGDPCDSPIVEPSPRQISNGELRSLDWAALSDREMEAVLLMGEGLATAEVGQRMGISPRTVDAFYSRIINKLAIAGRRELRRNAVAFARARALAA